MKIRVRPRHPRPTYAVGGQLASSCLTVHFRIGSKAGAIRLAPGSRVYPTLVFSAGELIPRRGEQLPKKKRPSKEGRFS